jgi:hypothetical protein
MKGKNFLFFLYILDTGGWLFVRPIVIFAYSFWILIKQRFLINQSHMALWMVAILLMLPSIVNGSAQGVTLPTAITYIYPLLIIPFYFLLTNGANLNTNTLIAAGAFFAFFVLVVFTLRLLGVGLIESFVEYLKSSPNAGFFDDKSAFTSAALPAVYFKATLLLVPFGVLAAYTNRWTSFTLIFSALAVAPSRTGILVLLLFISPLYFSGSRKYLRSLIALILLSGVAFYIISASEELIDDFIFGGSTRFLHIISMQEFFAENPEYFFWGSGPGSTFFSYAFINQENGGFTDDSEISQLEILRRYGVFFLLYICILYGNAVRLLIKYGCKADAMALLSYFVVSASNPVLLTAPACFYYTVVARTIATNKHR